MADPSRAQPGGQGRPDEGPGVVHPAAEHGETAPGAREAAAGAGEGPGTNAGQPGDRAEGLGAVQALPGKVRDPGDTDREPATADPATPDDGAEAACRL